MAAYMALLSVLYIASSYFSNEFLIYLFLPLVFMGPGAVLSFVAVLVWQTRSQECWRRVWGLPLRGRWLCALITTVWAVTASLALLVGCLFTLINVWQATRPH